MSGVYIIITFAITLGFAGKTRYSYDFLQHDIIIFIEEPKLCHSRRRHRSCLFSTAYMCVGSGRRYARRVF